MTHMGLYDTGGRKTSEFQYLFGAVTTAKKDYYDHLKDVIKLEKTEPVKKKFNHADTGDPISVGWGMRNEEVPKFAQFGKNIILLYTCLRTNVLAFVA
jgi:hypothetical protein